jgi:hypothetical protein
MRIINLSLISICMLCLLVTAKAQQGIMQLNNGITVYIKTKATPSGKSTRSMGNIYSSNSGNVIHRIMTDKKNKIYFGYDLEVERQEKTGKFKVSIKPLSKEPGMLVRNSGVSVHSKETVATGSSTGSSAGVGRNSTGKTVATGSSAGVGRNSTGRTTATIYGSDYRDYTYKSLPNYPADVIVEDGDSITLDLLENGKTKTTISDIIKIVYKSRFGFNFSVEDTPKDFSFDKVLLQMERPTVFVNQKEFKTRTSIAGNFQWVYIHGKKGRFIFSFTPQPKFNFKKIGLIQDNKILFEFDGVKYRFVSKTPILLSGGKWNLWVMHDPDYQPTYEVSEEDPFIFGAAGKVENLFPGR